MWMSTSTSWDKVDKIIFLSFLFKLFDTYVFVDRCILNISWRTIVLNISHSKYLEHADSTKKLHAIISLNKSLFNFCIFVVDFMHNDKLNASCDILLDRIIHLLTTYFSRSLFSFYVIYSTCIIPLFQPSYVDQYLHNYVIYRKCGIYEQLVLKNLYS